MTSLVEIPIPSPFHYDYVSFYGPIKLASLYTYFFMLSLICWCGYSEFNAVSKSLSFQRRSLDLVYVYI